MIDDNINELKGLRKAIVALTSSPYASASVAVAGETKSYTTANLSQLLARERELIRIIAEYSRGGGLTLSYPFYCGA